MDVPMIPLKGLPLSALDESDFERLPDATRSLCERMIASRMSSAREEAEQDGYEDGLRAAFETRESEAEDRGYRRGLAEGLRRAAGKEEDHG